MARNYKLKIIAEIASSHNGDLGLAKKMIREAATTGVDVVKFQSWQSKNVSKTDPDKKRYESLELSDEAHHVLMEECRNHGVEFLTSCYDSERIDFLKNELGLKRVKISSTDLKHLNFLQQIRDNFEEVIVSTGMSTKDEIKQALEILRQGEFTVMHCVSIYPCPLEKANMMKLNWLKSLTPNIGYSDHTEGVEAAVFAMGMGARYIEKHFTLDKDTPQLSHSVGQGLRPITTHSIASEPDVFRDLCDWRDKFELAMGEEVVELFPEEKLTRDKYTGRLGNNN